MGVSSGVIFQLVLSVTVGPAGGSSGDSPLLSKLAQSVSNLRKGVMGLKAGRRCPL